MKTQPLLPILLTSLLWVAPAAQAQDEPPAPAVQTDMGIGETGVGENTDVGTPDPLSVIEDQNVEPPPPDVPGMPEFKDVDQAGPKTEQPDLESTEQGTVDAETPAPAEPEMSRQADGPNFQREQIFHRIYKKYNEQPTPLEAWEQVSANRSSQVYKVQSGDTLWDLSQTLFGEPSYWPKVWALNNDEVANPHEIDTWMQIRFFPGDLNEPPSVAVSEAPKLADAGTAAPADGIELPPPIRPRQPLVRKLPDSMPLYRNATVNQPPLDFTAVAPFKPIPRPNVALAYYVNDEKIDGSGFVKETEMGGQTASEYQYIFVETSSSERVFTVVRDIGAIDDISDARARDGRLIEVQGEIEIIDRASDRENIYRAIVKRNLTSVEVGSILVPGRIESVSTVDATPTSGPAVRLVGAQFSTNRRLVDTDGFVFLSGGSAAGLSVGMNLPVMADVKIRNPKSKVIVTDRRVGHVRIVKVSQHYATAYLTKIWDDIYIGDIVGGNGAVITPDATASSSDSAGSDSDLEFDNDAPMDAAPSDSPGAVPQQAPSGSDDELSLDDESEFSL